MMKKNSPGNLVKESVQEAAEKYVSERE